MVASSNSGRAIESGTGAKPSGPWTSPVASGSSVTTSRIGRLHVLERRRGALAVGHVIEEAQRAVEVVWAGRSERRDALPHQLGRPVHPFVARAAGEQRAEDLAGADQREALGRLPPRRVRPALDVVVDEDGAALGRRGGVELVAGAAGELLVPGVGLVEDPQRLLGGGGLGAGRAAVGLEPVAEAAVGVAVGGDGVAHGRGVAAAEEPLEAAAVEDAALGREEVLGD